MSFSKEKELYYSPMGGIEEMKYKMMEVSWTHACSHNGASVNIIEPKNQDTHLYPLEILTVSVSIKIANTPTPCSGNSTPRNNHVHEMTCV